VTVTTTVSGAVALLLYGARAGRDIDDSLVEAIIALRELVGPDTRELVDRWIAEGGPDGEQIYCLDQLLRDRFLAEPRFEAAVATIVGTGPQAHPQAHPEARQGAQQSAVPGAGQVAWDAIAALAEHCRREGFRGAFAWCQAALVVPPVAVQVGT
jgi:hypothetical protein